MDKQFQDLKKDLKGAADGTNEGGNQCCFIFPLEMGVYILGVIQIIYSLVGMSNAIWWLQWSFNMDAASIIFSLVMILCIAPAWIGGWFYLRFFIKKESRPEFKNQLPSAHFLNIISILAICIWAIVGGLIFVKYPVNSMGYGSYSKKNILGAILSNILTFLIYGGLNYYWLGVTKRYIGEAPAAA